MKQITESVNRARRIHFFGTGSYTNQTILRNLLEHSLNIGRMRNDAVLRMAALPAAGLLTPLVSRLAMAA